MSPSPITQAVRVVVAALGRWPSDRALTLRGCMLLSDFANVAALNGGSLGGIARSACLELGVPAALAALDSPGGHRTAQAIKFHVADILACLHAGARDAEDLDVATVAEAGLEVVVQRTLECQKGQAARACVEGLARGEGMHHGVRSALDEYYELMGRENPFMTEEEAASEEEEEQDEAGEEDGSGEDDLDGV